MRRQDLSAHARNFDGPAEGDDRLSVPVIGRGFRQGEETEIGIGWRLCRWCGHASHGHCNCPGGGLDHSGRWHFAGISRVAGWAGRTRGGAGVTIGALRVTFWGALVMGVTAGVGAFFGTGA
jgi:hypothetical protein